MPLAIPMVWREGKDHIIDCYFCIINLKGINCKNKHHVQYPDVPAAIRPTPHGQDLPVPESDGNMEYRSDSKHSDMTVTGDDAHKPEEDDQPVPLAQAELKDLTPDLNLSQEFAQLPGSCLKEKYLLAPRITFYWYWDCERELRQFFLFQDKSSLVDCNNIAGVIKSTDLEYDAMMEWRLFIDHPAEVSKQFFYIMGIVFHQSTLGIQYKGKKLTTAWIICCLLLTTRSTNGWSVENLRSLDWSLGSKVDTQSNLVFYVSGTAGLMTNIMSDKRGH